MPTSWQYDYLWWEEMINSPQRNAWTANTAVGRAHSANRLELRVLLNRVVAERDFNLVA